MILSPGLPHILSSSESMAPWISIALFPLLVLFTLYFLQILKLSLADEFTQTVQFYYWCSFLIFPYNYVRWIDMIIPIFTYEKVKMKIFALAK